MICLSFDTDHMDEARMREFLKRVDIPGAATFFCTQRYESLEATRHELCPHPFLEQGRNWEEELRAKRDEFPQARGWRSHSCVFSHILAEQVGRLGYRYVSTHDDFGRPGPRPHRHCWGIWHMPIYYMDNLDFSRTRFWPDDGRPAFAPALIEQAVVDDGIYVFDFHPIHLLLNSDSTDWYFKHRDRFLGGEPVERLNSSGYGVRSFYQDLRARMAEAKVESVAMEIALSRFLEEAESAASRHG
jgi:hypothetical protein